MVRASREASLVGAFLSGGSNAVVGAEKAPVCAGSPTAAAASGEFAWDRASNAVETSPCGAQKRPWPAICGGVTQDGFAIP